MDRPWRCAVVACALFTAGVGCRKADMAGSFRGSAGGWYRTHRPGERGDPNGARADLAGDDEVAVGVAADGVVTLTTAECTLTARASGSAALIDPGQACTTPVPGAGRVLITGIHGIAHFSGDHVTLEWDARGTDEGGGPAEFHRTFDGDRAR